MLDAFDFDSRDGRALNRREQRAPQGIAHGRAESTLEGLRGKASVAVRQSVRICRQTARHLKARPEIILIDSHKILVLALEKNALVAQQAGALSSGSESAPRPAGPHGLLAIKFDDQLLID